MLHGDKRGRDARLSDREPRARRPAPAALRGLRGDRRRADRAARAAATAGSPRSGCGRPSARTGRTSRSISSISTATSTAPSSRSPSSPSSGPSCASTTPGRSSRRWQADAAEAARPARAAAGVIETARLILRPWEERDRAPFAALNGDPEVMRHFPGTLDRAGSDALVARIEARWAADGFGFAVAERQADGAFLGWSGSADADARGPPLDGAVEVGWRLARATGAGLRHRGGARLARLGLRHARPRRDRRDHRSGQQALAGGHAPPRNGGGPDGRFEHPAVPAGSPLRPHLIFRIEQRDRWHRENGAG